MQPRLALAAGMQAVLLQAVCLLTSSNDPTSTRGSFCRQGGNGTAQRLLSRCQEHMALACRDAAKPACIATAAHCIQVGTPLALKLCSSQ